MASAPKKDDDGCACYTWIVMMILFNSFVWMITLLPSMESIAYPDEKPTTCSVELAGFEGLQPAASPGATSPARRQRPHLLPAARRRRSRRLLRGRSPCSGAHAELRAGRQGGARVAGEGDQRGGGRTC
ncbi:unnamed protein product [Urochloa humidicola]